MKKTALLLAILITGCIPVDDFGAYWDKGIVDPALIGKWQQEPEKGQLKITEDNGAYRIDSLDKEETGKKDYKPITARTLNVGGYTYFMTGPKKSELVRYRLEGEAVVIYSLKGPAFQVFLKAKYPQAKNIRPETGLTNSVSIGVFDDEVFKVLSAIPDTQEYWKIENRYRKTR